jgi:phage-related protein
MSDFNYTPSWDSEVEDRHRTKRVDFGDGYDQESADGINSVRQVWSLRFDYVELADETAIRAFFAARVGQSFTWTPPGGTEKRWKLEGIVRSRRVSPTAVALSMTFKEKFGP